MNANKTSQKVLNSNTRNSEHGFVLVHRILPIPFSSFPTRNNLGMVRIAAVPDQCMSGGVWCSRSYPSPSAGCCGQKRSARLNSPNKTAGICCSKPPSVSSTERKHTWVFLRKEPGDWHLSVWGPHPFQIRIGMVGLCACGRFAGYSPAGDSAPSGFPDWTYPLLFLETQKNPALSHWPEKDRLSLQQ